MDGIKVRATRPGYYPAPGIAGYKNPGDEFYIRREGDFSTNWMLRLSPPPAPPKFEVLVPYSQAETVTVSSTMTVASSQAEVTIDPPRQKRKYVRRAPKQSKVGE